MIAAAVTTALVFGFIVGSLITRRRVLRDQSPIIRRTCMFAYELGAAEQRNGLYKEGQAEEALHRIAFAMNELPHRFAD